MPGMQPPYVGGNSWCVESSKSRNSLIDKCFARDFNRHKPRGAVIFTDFGFAAGPFGSDAQGKNGVPSGNIAVFRA